MNSITICTFFTYCLMMAYLGQACCEWNNKNICLCDSNPTIFVLSWSLYRLNDLSVKFDDGGDDEFTICSFFLPVLIEVLMLLSAFVYNLFQFFINSLFSLILKFITYLHVHFLFPYLLYDFFLLHSLCLTFSYVVWIYTTSDGAALCLPWFVVDMQDTGMHRLHYHGLKVHDS